MPLPPQGAKTASWGPRTLRHAQSSIPRTRGARAQSTNAFRRNCRSSVEPLARMPNCRAKRAPADPPKARVICSSATPRRAVRRAYRGAVLASRSPENALTAPVVVAKETADMQLDADRNALPRQIAKPPTVPAMRAPRNPLARWATASLRCGPQHHHEPVPPLDLQPIQNDFAGIRQQRPLLHNRRRTSPEPDPVLTPIVPPAKCQPWFTKSDEEPLFTPPLTEPRRTPAESWPVAVFCQSRPVPRRRLRGNHE